MKNIYVLPTYKPSREVWKDVVGYEGYFQRKLNELHNIKTEINLL